MKSLAASEKNERDLILSDAAICAVLKTEADTIGLTIEEYVDEFLKAFYKEPKKFYSLLGNISRFQ